MVARHSQAVHSELSPDPMPVPDPTVDGPAPEHRSRRRANQANDLDRLIHGRLRLGIMSALAVNERLTFAELREILDATDGNLSVHARKLEEAEYIDCRKFFAGRQPRTEYRISATGRAALQRYLAHMEALIAATRSTPDADAKAIGNAGGTQHNDLEQHNEQL